MNTFSWNSPIFVYGPPGSGKSQVGELLAASLNLPYLDLDSVVEASAGTSISELITVRGVQAWNVKPVPPMPARLAGGISLTCWILVVVFWILWFVARHKELRQIARDYHYDLAGGGLNWAVLTVGLHFLGMLQRFLGTMCGK